MQVCPQQEGFILSLRERNQEWNKDAGVKKAIFALSHLFVEAILNRRDFIAQAETFGVEEWTIISKPNMWYIHIIYANGAKTYVPTSIITGRKEAVKSMLRGISL